MANIYTIIVTYNGSAWIRKCLDTLLQSTVNTSIIVIDNASADDTCSVISKDYPHVCVTKLSFNIGFGRANNIGIKIAYDAGATHFFLLNQDACVEPDTIEKLVIQEEQNPQFGIISPMHLNGSGEGLDANFALYINPAGCADLFSDLCLNRALD